MCSIHIIHCFIVDWEIKRGKIFVRITEKQ